MTEPNLPKPYVERYRFTPMLVLCTVLFLGIGASWAWIGAVSGLTDSLAGWLMLLVPIVFFGGGGLAMLLGPLLHGLALRVDQDGVTLGRELGLMTHNGLWWRTPQVTVPWNDVDAVVLFSLANPKGGSVSCIGVRLRAGASLPPSEPTGFVLWQRLNAALGQERPPEDVSFYRQIFGWEADKRRLRRAVKTHATGVEVMSGAVTG